VVLPELSVPIAEQHADPHPECKQEAEVGTSSSQKPQNSQKVPQKRMRIWGRSAQATVSADAAHEAPKLTGTDPRNHTTEVEARILPLAAAAPLPLTLVSSTTPMAPTTKPLKGHKRFSADLRELKTGHSSDLDRGIWSVQSKFTVRLASTINFTNGDFLGFRSGEDDGSVEFELVDSRDQIRIVVYLLCSGGLLLRAK
jgi:ubiquitin-conjugating enzyme E2 Q